MKNPLRWVAKLFAPGAKDADHALALSSQEEVPAPRSPASTDELLEAEQRLRDLAAASSDQIVESVRTELGQLSARIDSSQQTVVQSSEQSQQSFQTTLGKLEASLSGRVEKLDSHVTQLEQSLAKRFTSLEESCELIEAKESEVAQRMASLESGLGALASVVERHLGTTERSLDALQASGEQRVRELAGEHRRQVEVLERSRTEAIHTAKQSHQRLAAQIEDVTGFIENDMWREVATPASALTPLEPAASTWKKPIASLKSWMGRGRRLQDHVASIQQRTLEVENLLRSRCDESRRRSEQLRKLVDQETNALPSAAPLASATSVAPTPEQTEELKRNVNRALSEAERQSNEAAPSSRRDGSRNSNSRRNGRQNGRKVPALSAS